MSAKMQQPYRTSVVQRNVQMHSRREFLGVLAGVGATSAAFRAWCAEHGADFDFASVAAECGWDPGASGDSPRKTLVKRHFAHFEERIMKQKGNDKMRTLCGTILAAVELAPVHAKL